MGQSQDKFNLNDGEHFSEHKPPEIIHLQELLDNPVNNNLKNTNNQLVSLYEVLIESPIHSGYSYGLKFDKSHLLQANQKNIQHFTFPVQIYLLQKNQPSKNILVFQGELLKGKRDKFGTEYSKDGKIFYQGNFKNNKYNGWGVTSIYQGQWANGVKCGFGKLKIHFNQLNQTVTYEGFWKNDKFDGLGMKNIVLSESKTFLDDQYEPTSIELDEQYIGEWLEGMKFGCGKLIKYTKKGTQINSEIYEGEFARNLYHGRGKIKLGSSNSQQAIFQAGKIVKST